MATHTNLDATSALDTHINSIQNRIPTSIRTACFPDSTSTLLRNIILAVGVLNVFLFVGSLSTVGVRYTGHSMLLLSLASCTHISFIGMVLGIHIAEMVASLGRLGGRLADVVRNTSTRYGDDVYAHGALFGSSLIMAILMQFASSYYKGLSACVANLSTHLAVESVENFTRDASIDENNSLDPFTSCGASGPVGFVAFFSGSLFWLNAGFAVVLYTKRGEIISGVSPVSSNQHYDEIGVENEFSGDFPSAVATIHV